MIKAKGAATVKSLINQLKMIERRGYRDAPVIIETGKDDYHQIFCLSGGKINDKFFITIETFNKNSLDNYLDNQDKIIDEEEVH